MEDFLVELQDNGFESNEVKEYELSNIGMRLDLEHGQVSNICSILELENTSEVWSQVGPENILCIVYEDGHIEVFDPESKNLLKSIS